MERKRAILKKIRVSPQKARLAAALIRGKSLNEAKAQLEHSPLKASRWLLKVLMSANANYLNQPNTDAEGLRVVEVRVDEGGRMRRAKAASKGSRSPIIKQFSHLTVVVGK